MQRDHTRKRPTGLRSTKVKVPAEGNLIYGEESDSDEEDENAEEADAQLRKKHKDIFVRVMNLQDKLPEKIYTDQMGKFPVRSSQGNQYLMIICEMDSDAIVFEPM